MSPPIMRVTGVVAICFAGLLATSQAFAHAHLKSAEPAAGSTVAPAPKAVVLSFTEELEPRFSSIEVRDGKGATVQAGPATPVPGNSAELRVPLKPLPPGTYKVIWRVLSVDTHRSQGTFTFKVGR